MWQRVLEAARNADSEEARRQVEAHRVRLDAYTARPSILATRTPAPLTSTSHWYGTERAQRQPVHVVRLPSATNPDSPRIDLESQTPAVIHAGTQKGEYDVGSVCFTVSAPSHTHVTLTC